MEERRRRTAAGQSTVHLLSGLPGAGKTTVARQLEAELPAVRFSLDEWMLRLYPELHFSSGTYVHYVRTPLQTAVERVVGRAGRLEAGSHRLDEADVRHLAGIFEEPKPSDGLPILP